MSFLNDFIAGLCLAAILIGILTLNVGVIAVGCIVITAWFGIAMLKEYI